MLCWWLVTGDHLVWDSACVRLYSILPCLPQFCHQPRQRKHSSSDSSRAPMKLIHVLRLLVGRVCQQRCSKYSQITGDNPFANQPISSEKREGSKNPYGSQIAAAARSASRSGLNTVPQYSIDCYPQGVYPAPPPPPRFCTHVRPCALCASVRCQEPFGYCTTCIWGLAKLQDL